MTKAIILNVERDVCHTSPFSLRLVQFMYRIREFLLDSTHRQHFTYKAKSEVEALPNLVADDSVYT
jgi:hypothetical protein